MHRWFFANEREECRLPEKEESESQLDIGCIATPPPIPTTDWPFCVVYNKPLKGNEFVAISGNCETLGNWQPEHVYVLRTRECTCPKGCNCRGGECSLHKAEICIPRDIDVEYRYCIVAVDPLRNVSIIRFWEVQLKPRIIRTCQNMLKSCDRFGSYNGKVYLVSRGWATADTYVHLKIFNAPFIWQQQRPRLLYVRITPMFEAKPHDCAGKATDDVHLTAIGRIRRTLLADADDLDQQLAYTEVANLGKPIPLKFQTRFGARCGPEDLVLYHCSIANPEDTLYRLDLYTYAYKAANDEPPYHFGFGFLQPQQLVGSEGQARVAITCASTHRPLMEMYVRYLLIHPLPNYRCDLRISYQRHWNYQHQPLRIGHRGTGPTYRLLDDVYRENTLSAFKRAAANRADMVEFDVHMTKDAHVVVYHDHVLKFTLQRYPPWEQLLEQHDLLIFPHEELCRLKLLQMGGCKRTDHIAMPFEAFTLDQLRLCRVLRFARSDSCQNNCVKMEEEQQPFPLLSDLFETASDNALPPKLGFKIELKWPQLDISNHCERGSFRSGFDRNFYVDTILEIVLQRAGQRRIIFSCFDVDTCAMLRFKQNRYPVILNIQNPQHELLYLDQRLQCTEKVFYLAYVLELFGLMLPTHVVLHQPELLAILHDLHLHAVAWGEENVDSDVRKQLKQRFIMGIVYDRIDQRKQIGEPLEGGNLCAIDNVETRCIHNEMTKEEFRIKCGLRTAHDTPVWTI